MKLTLLQLVQMIMSDMDSEDVNSISDTAEAGQVASIVKETYMDIKSRANLPEHFSLFELNGSGDSDLPTIMRLPSNVLEVQWVKYNNHESGTDDPYYQEVQYMDMKSFLDQMYSLSSSNTNVETNTIDLNGDNIDLLWVNDKFPGFYTTIDDFTVLFDSYQSSVDTTLQKSKTSCYGELEPAFTMTDGFIPDLDSKQFSLLLQEAKAQAFIDLKEVENAKAETRARKGWLNMQRQNKNFPVSFFDSLPNYGRRTGLTSRFPKSLRQGS